mmetsp:Transcript_14268/g.23731  ORF Transcript_14268/g.23731 Transcript_14268/m.23731 type:complete len:167 (-) Transcript_14268:105-605(-)
MEYPVGVIQDVTTRWWSTYQMTSRLCRLQHIIGQMAQDNLIACNLTDEQWKILKQINDILEPFMATQKALEGEKYVTCSLIPYLVNHLRTSINEAIGRHTNNQPVLHLLNLMKTDFEVRFGTGENGTVWVENLERADRNRQKGIPTKILLAHEDFAYQRGGRSSSR